MLQCVCGYQKGNPSSRRCFASLLKGNESFYSKINWSTGRRRRERRVPERFSEYHLEHDSAIDAVSPPPTQRHSTEDNKIKNKGPRGSNSSSSRPSSPSKNSSPPTIPATQQRGNRDASQPQGTRKKWEPIRIKVCKDEIKLLRWDSFVSLSKVYVAPDQDIFCMEHVVYNCPCIESNRRIIRIASKYVPTNDSVEKKTTPLSSPNNNAKASSKVTPPNKNVAKKHTHPNMRLANVPKAKAAKSAEEAVQIPAPVQEPVAKTSSLSKMRKLLQDERFNLSKLMTEEKTRAFDEEVDLNVPQGQTVQLVAWIRFHRIYQSGRMHVRFLSRRAGPVILVMRPNEIVAADITCDIQTMQRDQNAPEIVKELLEPCISPEESSRYAFLLCDGVKWELVGCITLKAPETPTPPPVKTSVAGPKSRVVRQPSPKQQPLEREIPEPPEVFIEEQHEEEDTEMRSLTKSPTRPAANPASERFNAMEQKRKELEERLIQIKQKLNVPQPKRMSGTIKPAKSKHRTTSAPRQTEPPLILEELLSLPPSGPGSISSISRRLSRRESNPSYLIPDQCILPDDLPRSDTDLGSKEQPKTDSNANKLNLPDLVCPQVVKDPSLSMYPAAERLAMFSRLIQSNGNPGLDMFSKFGNSSALGTLLSRSKQSKSRSKTVPAAPTQSTPPPLPQPPPPPASLAKPPEKLILHPIGSTLPSGISLPNSVRRIRFVQSPSVLSAPKKGLELSLIQQQRMHWSSFGVKPPVVTKTISSADGALITTEEVPVTSVAASAALLSDQCANQPPIAYAPIVSKESAGLSTVTPVAFIPDSQPQFTSIPEAPKQQMEENKPATPKEVAPPELPEETPPPEKCVFPNVLTAEVSSIQSKGNATQSLKIILEAMTGQHRELCPSRASMLLPLHNIDDRWGLVALDHIPKCGFRVPGLSVFIPGDLLGRAASAAIERKARVSFPLRFQLKNKESAFKPGFGVYGTPQLPRHVFVGPFPANHFENCSPQPGMFLITLTKPVPSDSASPNASSLLRSLCMKSTEPTTPAVPSIEKEKETVQPESEVLVPAEKTNQKEEQSDGRCVASSDEDVAVIATVSSKTPTAETELPEANTVTSQMAADDVESNEMDTANETTVEEPSSHPALPLPSEPLSSEDEAPLPKPRKFVARVQGLPATTLAVFPNEVLVKHPLNPEEVLKFDSIDKAKCWLQTLANRTIRNELNGSDGSKTSHSREDSSSESSDDEVVDVCGQDENREEEAEDSTASRSSNKRVRRMTEKAKMLAASKSKPTRHSVLKRTFSMSSSTRNSVQRQLHIRKEQVNKIYPIEFV